MAAAEQPIFYYDLGSPYAYLAAERIQRILPVVPIWQPILLGGIWKETGGRSWATTDKRDRGMAEIERRAAEYGLMQVRWPDGWPNNTLTAMRTAIFAQQTGRAVAFSLAAFRQLRGRQGPIRCRQRPDRRGGLRVASERRAEGPRDAIDEGRPPKRDP